MFQTKTEIHMLDLRKPMVVFIGKTLANGVMPGAI